jgi:hypothetical protein
MIVIGAAEYETPMSRHNAKYTGLIRPERSATTQNIAYNKPDATSAAKRAVATDFLSASFNFQVGSRRASISVLQIARAGIRHGERRTPVPSSQN